MKCTVIRKLLAVFVSVSLSFYAYADIDDLINVDYASEPATRGLVINRISDIGKQLKKVDDRAKKIDNTVDDIEDDLKDLADTTDNVEQKACDIESKVDDLIETSQTIEQKVCVPCDFIITSADINPGADTFTITEPGVYCLAQNVTNPNPRSPIIDIRVECVTLDLHDHAIEGGPGADPGILVCGVGNVTIKDGIVKGAVTGIKVLNSDGPVMISNIKVTDGDAGISIVSSKNVVVEECNASRNGSSFGFGVDGDSSGCIFRNCVGISNSFDGFRMEGGTEDCTFDNCFAANNSESGFGVRDNSENCVFNNCFAGGNSDVGFLVRNDARACRFNNCVAGDNNAAGFGIEANGLCCLINCKAIGDENQDEGFNITSDNNVLEFCSAQGNKREGFKIDGNSNTLRSSQAIDNGFAGFAIVGYDPANVHNLIRECVAINNGKSDTSGTKHGFTVQANAECNEILGNTAVFNKELGFSNDDDNNKFFNNTSHFNTTANYGGTIGVELVLKPNDISGHWINVDCDATEIGVFESKICHIASVVDEIIAAQNS